MNCYDKFINIQEGVERVDIQYIQNLIKLAEIPKEKKKDEYKSYTKTHTDYLYSFTEDEASDGLGRGSYRGTRRPR